MDETSRCAHCGLPLAAAGRRGRERPAGPGFCCLGCRLASTVAGGEDGPRQFLEARLLLATFLAMGVMTFSLVLYGEALHATGGEPGLAAIRNAGRAVLALFALPVLLLLGVPLVQGAWADLADARVRMDGLIVLATFAAYGLSLHATWTGTGQVYFETATMVLVLVTFGRRLEAHARTQGRDAAALLADCLPEHAHREGPDGTLTDVTPGELAAGDVCHLLPGEAVPADVIVLRGAGEASCAHLTGEAAPRPAGPGVALPAGALLGATALVARVERPAAASSLARLRALLDAPLALTDRMRLVDRLAGWLAGLALALALLGGLRSGLQGGPGEGLRTALSVLLVACPCALGLATPLAYRALRAALARHGLLVHDAAALERAAAVTHVLLDKTGTLTDPTGALRVVWSDGAGGADLLERLVRHSGHPLARSVGTRPGPPPEQVELLPGAGVRGVVDGVSARVGSPAWIDAERVRWPEAARRHLEGGQSLVVAAAEGAVVAVAVVDQRLRPGARAALDEVVGLGLPVEILSGDRPQAAARIAAEVGVPCRGGLSPADKLARVQSLRGDGAVVLLAGDGVNDAPALRAADVGLALGSGTAAARAQAGVELVGDELSALPRLLRGARRLRRTVAGNLTWSLLYNAVALGLATAGRLHPLAAAAAMIVSSLVVSVRSYRLLDWEAPAGAAPGAPTRRSVPADGPAVPSPAGVAAGEAR